MRLLVATGIVWFSVNTRRWSFDMMPLREWRWWQLRRGHAMTIYRLGPFKYTRWR